MHVNKKKFVTLQRKNGKEVIMSSFKAVKSKPRWRNGRRARFRCECTFAQIVRIRDRLARGRPLEKADQEWYRNNRQLVDFKRTYTGAEDEMVKSWGF